MAKPFATGDEAVDRMFEIFHMEIPRHDPDPREPRQLRAWKANLEKAQQIRERRAFLEWQKQVHEIFEGTADFPARLTMHEKHSKVKVTNHNCNPDNLFNRISIKEG